MSKHVAGSITRRQAGYCALRPQRAVVATTKEHNEGRVWAARVGPGGQAAAWNTGAGQTRYSAQGCFVGTAAGEGNAQRVGGGQEDQA
jgi:hypothetical protein